MSHRLTSLLASRSRRARLPRRLAGPACHVALSVVALATLDACVDEFPLPDEFDAAFVTGEVCLPTNIATGTTEADGAPAFPVRISTCVYRCVEIEPGSVALRSAWVCSGAACEMTLLASAHVKRVGGDDCDARDLPDPPASECTPQTFDFMMTPPCCTDNGAGNEFRTGPFRVTVPYLDLDQGNAVVARINAGESPSQVITEEIGLQSYESRQFLVNFDPTNPVVDSHDALGPETCHAIAAP